MRHIFILLTFIIPNVLFSQWVISNSGTTETLRTVFFINSLTGFAGGNNGLVIKTTNNGVSWSNVNTMITENINSIYFLNSSSGIACANDGKIIITSNAGSSWSSVSSGVTDNLFAISFFNNRGVCSGNLGTLLYSSNGGANWSIAENGFLIQYFGVTAVSETIAYACGVNTIFQPFVAKSTNGGVNWTFSNFYLNGNEGDLTDINFISENEGFASSAVFDGQGGISYTNNGGTNWTTQLFPSYLNGIDFIGMNTGYSSGGNGLILKTTDRGATWNSQSNPATVTLRRIDFVDGLNGFTVGDNGVILKTTNGGVTSINNIYNSHAVKFSLSQNFPNPFNPVTKIKFEIPSNVKREMSNVKLTIYNSLGEEVLILLNQTLSAGSYEVTFDGTDFPGGIYFYTLQSKEYSETRKFVLLK